MKISKLVKDCNNGYVSFKFYDDTEIRFRIRFGQFQSRFVLPDEGNISPYSEWVEETPKDFLTFFRLCQMSPLVRKIRGRFNRVGWLVRII